MAWKKYIERFRRKKDIPTRHDLATRLEEKRVLALHAKKVEKERKAVLEKEHARLKGEIKTEKLRTKIRRMQQPKHGYGYKTVRQTAQIMSAPSVLGPLRVPEDNASALPRLNVERTNRTLPSFGGKEREPSKPLSGFEAPSKGWDIGLGKGLGTLDLGFGKKKRRK